MTSIGTEKASRGYPTLLALVSLLPVFTRILCVPFRAHASDGHYRFSSLSPYRPSFSNRSRRAVGLSSFGAVARPPIVGFIVFTAQTWSVGTL